MRKLITLALGVTCLIASFGCGGDNSLSTGDQPFVRYVNALNAQTDIKGFVDGNQVGGIIPREGISDRGQFNNGNHTLTVRNAATNDVLVSRENQLLEENSSYLVVAFNSDPTSTNIKLGRTNNDTTAGKEEVTFFRATNQFGDIDVYLVKAGQGLLEENKVELLVNGEASRIVTVDPGDYAIRAFAHGDTTTQLWSRDVSLHANQNDMLIVTTSTLDNSARIIRVIEHQP